MISRMGKKAELPQSLESVLQDLRFAVRQLRKNPGFAGTAILVLALGMAASVAIFAFLDAALLRPLPYRNASRLVVAYETTNSCRDCNLSYPDYLDWKKANTSFRSFEAWDASVYLWRGPEGVQAVRSAHVSGGFFRTLGVAAMLGRVFTETDDTPAAPRTVVLTVRHLAEPFRREAGYCRAVADSGQCASHRDRRAAARVSLCDASRGVLHYDPRLERLRTLARLPRTLRIGAAAGWCFA